MRDFPFFGWCSVCSKLGGAWPVVLGVVSLLTARMLVCPGVLECNLKATQVATIAASSKPGNLGLAPRGSCLGDLSPGNSARGSTYLSHYNTHTHPCGYRNKKARSGCTCHSPPCGCGDTKRQGWCRPFQVGNATRTTTTPQQKHTPSPKPQQRMPATRTLRIECSGSHLEMTQPTPPVFFGWV